MIGTVILLQLMLGDNVVAQYDNEDIMYQLKL